MDDRTVESLRHATAAVGGSSLTAFPPAVLAGLYRKGVQDIRAGRVQLRHLAQYGHAAKVGQPTLGTDRKPAATTSTGGNGADGHVGPPMEEEAWTEAALVVNNN